MAKSGGQFDGWVKPLLFFTLVATVFLAFGVYHTATAVKKMASADAEQSNITNADYKCDEEKTVSAVYWDDKVELNLSDGRQFLLMQAISGSGVRYTDSNESITFWNKGDTAFIEEGPNDRVTYNNCVQTTAQ